MLDWTEIISGDDWELFARDFLIELGFVVENDPSRGPDGGQDLIVSEQLTGKFYAEKITWLVSCKHYAKSGSSVGSKDEQSISDRLKQHKAKGFIGFYSTMASTGLANRLSGLEFPYQIFDGRKIESHFVTTGLSRLALRYFPDSYNSLRPIQKLTQEFVRLDCEICGVDLLLKSLSDPMSGIVTWAQKYDETTKNIVSIHTVCKGVCDDKLEDKLRKRGLMTTWEDIDDLCKPIVFLRNMMTYTNMLRDENITIAAEAHEKIKCVFIAIAQRTLRETTLDDLKRFNTLVSLEGL